MLTWEAYHNKQIEHPKWKMFYHETLFKQLYNSGDASPTSGMYGRKKEKKMIK